jgi:hypothetical protein
VEEFMSVPELQGNPLVQRVIDILDEDNNGTVDFQGGTHIHGNSRDEDTRPDRGLHKFHSLPSPSCLF